MLTPHCSAASGMVVPSSIVPTTRLRRSSEYGFAIHAGLLPADSLNHIRLAMGIPRFSLLGKRSSCGSTPLLGPLNGRLNILAMRAHVASGAIHNDFWGIGAVSETPSIPVLPLRRCFQRKRVLPAQSVPVGDMERQR